MSVQVPRLTSTLREILPSYTALGRPSIDELYIKRNALLKQRRHDSRSVHTDSSRAQLITLTLGDWHSSPKQARETFEKYMKSISDLLIGEPSSEAVAAAALATYHALHALPPVADDDVRRLGPRAALLQPVSSSISASLGGEHNIDKAALDNVVERYRALADWSTRLVASAAAAIRSHARGGVISSGNDGFHFTSDTADYSLNVMSVDASTATDALLSLCGLAAKSAVAVQLLDATYRRPSFPLPATDDTTQQQRGTPGVPPSAEEIAAIEAEIFRDGAPSTAATRNADIGARWLVRWCSRVATGNGYVAPFGGSSSNGSSRNDAGDDDVMDTLGTSVAMMLLDQSVTDDTLAASVFDLMGENVFDHIGSLLEVRKALTTNIKSMIRTLREKEEEAIASIDNEAGGASKSVPSYATGVSVMSESEKAIMKAERKAERKREKHRQQPGFPENHGNTWTMSSHDDGVDTCSDLDADWLSRHGIYVVALMEEEKEKESMIIKLGNGAELRLGDGTSIKATLPTGTTRKAFKGYEEVSVPAVPPAVPPPHETSVLISQLPEWAQRAFQGYTKLNRIQSRIFPTAFYSNENVLVCAPTGAGKTNIAMISVLREVGQHMRGDVIAKDQFKIVYVAPMKALAAEVTASFSKRLHPLGLMVKELTGDMQMSKTEMAETQMIVTTPEKWDVITRKGGEVSVAASVKLLIIDEVHLLNDERGPVIETLVARTSRQVETSQSMIRIVGLSATLPNYKDVATFLGVNIDTGLFYFDASYRPVPLATSFIGVSEKNFLARQSIMDEVCYQKVVDAVKRGHQAMVFVHSRKDTGKTARMLALKAQQNGETAIFDCTEGENYHLASKDIKKSRNKEVTELFDSGVGLHHAGMLRSDRSLMERLFSQGLLKVLCCTATLAWGVNLPAHAVIIKGTQLYNPQKGGFTDLGMLDVQQIFGRAGRPQYQDSGEAFIITTHDKLAHYLGMLTHSVPIESQFTVGLADHLNAEIVLGTVTTIKEAISWLGYTYLYTRMTKNPLPYGISWQELSSDPPLEAHRRKLVTNAAHELERSKMARFDQRSGNLYVTDLGRVASHFYIKQASIEVFNELLKPHMTEADVLSMISKSSEFDTLAVRDEELSELDDLAHSVCPFEPKGGSENKHGKANILLQAYISRARIDSFSLIADSNYVAQNAPRIARALFEICLKKSWSAAAELTLTIAKAFERRLWPHHHPLWQFEDYLKYELLKKLDERHFDIDQLRDMSSSDIGAALRHPAAGQQISYAIKSFPTLAIEPHVQPVTRSVLRIQLDITPQFTWHDAMHGSALRWLIWVEDSNNERIYHSEMWTLTKKMAKEGTQKLAFAVPMTEPIPPQYYVKAVSDSWLASETMVTLTFKGLILPERHPPHTKLLNLEPLPLSALDNPLYESLYKGRFGHFNPIQTQAFHPLYHTDENILLGAPTGSGKTISAELTVLRLLNAHKGSKAVYIAPLKALVRERIKDWGGGFCKTLGLKLVELTGDYTPDLKALLASDIIVATPEKWDGISRNWQGRGYVRKVGLMILDEIHLLGADRGPILEVIVSRMRYISTQTGSTMRFVGLSTALANAIDLADWLGVGKRGLFNFKPSVRPVPLECHIQGYPGKFYCPRMATMNKPAYAAIQTHSPTKPVLIFVASRRQTRLTAVDIIAHAAADERPRTFLKMSDGELDGLLPAIKVCVFLFLLNHHRVVKYQYRYDVSYIVPAGRQSSSHNPIRCWHSPCRLG